MAFRCPVQTYAQFLSTRCFTTPNIQYFMHVLSLSPLMYLSLVTRQAVIDPVVISCE